MNICMALSTHGYGIMLRDDIYKIIFKHVLTFSGRFTRATLHESLFGEC